MANSAQSSAMLEESKGILLHYKAHPHNSIASVDAVGHGDFRSCTTPLQPWPFSF